MGGLDKHFALTITNCTHCRIHQNPVKAESTAHVLIWLQFYTYGLPGKGLVIIYPYTAQTGTDS